MQAAATFLGAVQTADSVGVGEELYSREVSAFPVSLDSSVESLDDPDSCNSPPGSILLLGENKVLSPAKKILYYLNSLPNCKLDSQTCH